MEKGRGITLNRLILGLTALCAVCVLVVMAKILSGGWENLPFSTGPNNQTSTVRITYITRYLKCQDYITVQEDISTGHLDSFLNGLSQEWTAIGQDNLGIQLMQTIDDYCPFHNETRLLKLVDGVICLYRGDEPDELMLIRQYPHLTESRLDTRTIELLERGVVITGEADEVDDIVAKYLEGIDE